MPESYKKNNMNFSEALDELKKRQEGITYRLEWKRNVDRRTIS